MDELLIFLLKQGANKKNVSLTTTEIGQMLEMSQQNVSRRLQLLEEEGIIIRERDGIRITDKGVAALKDLLATLKNAFSTKIKIEGIITEGLGEGKFYLSQKEYQKEFIHKLGFDPYPGTLNLKLSGEAIDKRRQLLQMDPIIIEGFERSGRRFGDLFAYKAKINGVECAIVVPIRTHHGSEILEIAAPTNLKEKFGKKEGDRIKLEVE
jgi:riboflavin kinase